MEIQKVSIYIYIEHNSLMIIPRTKKVQKRDLIVR